MEEFKISKQIRFYTKDIYKNVNNKNKFLLDDYSQSLLGSGLSKSSIYQYKSDIRGFYCWLYKYQNNSYILDIHKRSVFQFYFSIYSNNNVANNRVNRIQYSLRNLLKFAVDNEDYRYNKNIMNYIHKLPACEKQKRIFLTDKQISIIINYLLHYHLYEEGLYLSLSYDSAARLNEILQVNKQRDLLKHDITNDVIGENGAKFPLIYFDRTRYIYKLWIHQRKQDNIESIWCTNKNHKRTKANRNTIHKWTHHFSKILKLKTNISLNITPRVLRRSSLYNYLTGNHYYLKGNTRNTICMYVYLSHCVDPMAMRYFKLKNMHRLTQYLGIPLY